MSRGAKDALVNWLLAIAIVVVYAFMQQPVDDHSAENTEAKALEVAQKEDAARTRYLQAAARMCGNADFVELDPHTIQCVKRKGAGNAAPVQVAEVQS